MKTRTPTDSPSDCQIPDRGNGGVNAPCLELFEALTPHELIGRSRSAVERVDTRVLELTDDQLDRTFPAESGVGLWSPRMLVTHLMDVEVLYTMRLRRTLAEDNPVLEEWDEQAFLDSRLSVRSPDALLMPAGACLAVLHTLRQTMATVLVQLNPVDWQRRAMNPFLGETTFRTMVAYATWHLEHHAAFLRAKLDAILGPAPDTPSVPAGGCGPGCACVDDSAPADA
jgi:hypothetical protein